MNQNFCNIILKIVCSIFFYKCFYRKYRRIWNFYLIVNDMYLIKNFYNKKFIAVLLIVFDISIPIYFILFNKLYFIYLCVIILIQMFYLVEMFMPKAINNNCGCFINLPKRNSFFSILNNLVVSGVFIWIFILDNT